MKLASNTVVTGADGPILEPATLVIEGEWITQVLPGVDPDATLVDAVVVPGFVDTHCHGAMGAAFADPDPQAVRAAIELHRRHGTTSLFASTVTESIPDVIEQITRLRPLVEAGELAGIHLEGPFLSEAKKGAHNPELLCDPSPEAVGRIIAASDDALAMITIAPEREGALDAIATFTDAGVMAAFGHSDADAATAHAAIEAGAGVATHLFNAMNPIHHRVPGPVPALLHDPRVMVELICDGVHLDPDVVTLAIDAAGIDRVGLITDAMGATGAADGRYQLGSLEVDVTHGRARILNPDGSLGAIAGSTLTMDRAVAFVVATGRTVSEAAIMASTTPAARHGLDEVGVLASGRLADLCLLDQQGNLVPGRSVLRRGAWIEPDAGTRP